MNSTITVEFKAIGLAGSGSGFTCCELGFENNPKKLQKGGFPHMQKKDARASRQERLRMRVRMRDLSGSSGLRGVRCLNR